MNVNDLALIPDPAQRLAQAQRFLRNLERTEYEASKIRDQALLLLRDEGMSQQDVADLIGVTQQRVGQMQARAKMFSIMAAEPEGEPNVEG